MKVKKIFLFLIFLFTSVITFSISYDISRLSIDGVLNKDGSMKVSETVIYDIDEINGVLFFIDAKEHGGITSLRIFEDTGLENGEYKYTEVDPLRYEVTENYGLYKVKLYSKNKNNRRAFTFNYTLPEAVKVYDDVAQLNRKMVGKNWDQPIAEVQVQISVPVDKNYDNSKILVFGHGPLTGDITKKNNIMEYNLEYLYPGEFVEAHILMDTEIFSEMDKNKIIHKSVKHELLDMEKRLADEANEIRKKALEREELNRKLSKYLGIIFWAQMGLWLFAMYYILVIFKKGNKYKGKFGKYLREAPNNYTPAMVAGIVSPTPGIPTSEGILATILDLIRRKNISLEEEGKKNKLILKEEKGLKKGEKIITDIYFNYFGDGKSVVLEDIKSKKIPLKIAEEFEDWKESVILDLMVKGIEQEKLSFKKKAIFLLIAAIFIFTSITLADMLEDSHFSLLLIMAFILIGVTFTAKGANIELQKAKAKCVAFKNFLEDYSQLEEAKISSIHLWEEYFVYAVALGVSEKVVKSYKRALKMGQIPEETSSNLNTLSTLTLMDMYSKGTFAKSMNNITRRTYNRSIANLSASRASSSSGGGGGFSSGSSGGGGSGGGGGAF